MYVATGKSYFEEALESIKSLHTHTPTLSVTLFTDQEELVDDKDFETTLYLDTDTSIEQDISDVFELLKDHDIAVAKNLYPIPTHYPDIDPSISIINTGVILYRNTEKVRNLFDMWLKDYKAHTDIEQKDEPSFYATFLKEKPDFITLPRTYNYRDRAEPLSKASAKIIHRQRN